MQMHCVATIKERPASIHTCIDTFKQQVSRPQYNLACRHDNHSDGDQQLRSEIRVAVSTLIVLPPSDPSEAVNDLFIPEETPLFSLRKWPYTDDPDSMR